MIKTGPTDPNVQALVQVLGKADQPKIWRTVAKQINAPLRSKKVLNVDQLNLLANEGETIVIASKVLGSGVLTKKITVGALNYSNEAKRKITAAGGKALSIDELWSKNPKGTNIRILK